MAFANQIAKGMGSLYINPEHVFLGLFKPKDGPLYLQAKEGGYPIDDVVEMMWRYAREKAQEPCESTGKSWPVRSQDVETITVLAMEYAEQCGAPTVLSEHLLRGFLYRCKNRFEEILQPVNGLEEHLLPPPINEQ